MPAVVVPWAVTLFRNWTMFIGISFALASPTVTKVAVPAVPVKIPVIANLIIGLILQLMHPWINGTLIPFGKPMLAPIQLCAP